MKKAIHKYERSHLARARDLRERSTDAEQKLWFYLRRRALEGYRFRRQVPIGRYIVDFFCPEIGLIVELDGGQHSDQQKRDAVRTQWLQSRGYRVVRFWNNDVFENTVGALEVIRAELIAARAATDPPPMGPIEVILRWDPLPSPSRGEGKRRKKEALKWPTSSESGNR